MIDRCLKLSLTLAVLILLGAIVAGALFHPDGSPDFRPVLAALRGLRQWVAVSAQQSTTQVEDPPPFAAVAGDAAQKMAAGANRLSEMIADDPRLAVCPVGSIDSQAIREIPLNTAKALQQKIDGGAQFQSLIDVQAQLGNPVCNWRSGSTTKWRFLVEGLRLIDVSQPGDQPKIRFSFTNF
ncbi:MAG: hypothetical protein F6K19_33845 [Cyanothece sp. SIO1E1]|nr:hypothetical protein [Cyanothece sp. SIO1E1]